MMGGVLKSYLREVAEDEPDLAPRIVQILETLIQGTVHNAAREAVQAEREKRELVQALYTALRTGKPLPAETEARVRQVLELEPPQEMPRTGTR